MSQTGTAEAVKTKSEIRKEKTTQLRKYHEPIFRKLGIPDAYFLLKSKSFNIPVGKVGFFQNELTQGKDIYFELTDFGLNIIDAKRPLYVLRGDAGFQSNPTKYQFIETSQISLYFVSMEDVKEVTETAGDMVIEIKEEVNREDGDIIGGMTDRDYAAIHLRVPQSNKPWLNTMINQAKDLN